MIKSAQEICVQFGDKYFFNGSNIVDTIKIRVTKRTLDETVQKLLYNLYITVTT